MKHEGLGLIMGWRGRFQSVAVRPQQNLLPVVLLQILVSIRPLGTNFSLTKTVFWLIPVRNSA